MLSPVLTVVACAAAFLAGLVDAIAGGGGLITLPVMLGVGLPPHQALATNKGQSVFGALTSLTTYWRRDNIDKPRAPVAFVAGLVGSALGAVALLAIRPEPLRPLVLVLMVAAVAVVLGRPYIQRHAPMSAVSPAATPVAVAVIGLGLGAYDGFFGPGTGSLLIIAFTMVFGESLTRASGNAKVVNLASNLAAVAIFSYRGTVQWAIALPMAGANILGAAIGTRLALRNGDKLVRALILVAVTGAMIKVGLDLRR